MHVGEGQTHRLDDTTRTAEAKYPINFTRPVGRFRLSLDHYGSDCFLIVNVVKMYHFKAKNPK